MKLGNWLAYEVFGRKTPPRRHRKPRRGPARDPLYRAFVRTFPCCVCGRLDQAAEAAHTGHDGGMRQKSNDYSCVPLCAEHHYEFDNGLRSNHLFEQDWGLDMAKISRDLTRLYFEQRRVA